MFLSLLLGFSCVKQTELINGIKPTEECAYVSILLREETKFLKIPINQRSSKIEDNLYYCCPDKSGIPVCDIVKWNFDY